MFESYRADLSCLKTKPASTNLPHFNMDTYYFVILGFDISKRQANIKKPVIWCQLPASG